MCIRDRLCRLLKPYTCGRIEPFKDNRLLGCIRMKEIVTIDDWENTLSESKIILLITKKTCKDCIIVERYLKLNNYFINKIPVRKISLDNPNSEIIRNQIEWINIEVDIIPFWVLMNRGKRLLSIRGDINQAMKISTFSQVNRSQED